MKKYIVGIGLFTQAFALSPVAELNCLPLQRQTFAESQIVLDGSNSSDPENGALTYSWKVNNVLQSATTSQVEYQLAAGETEVDVELCVLDGEGLQACEVCPIEVNHKVTLADCDNQPETCGSEATDDVVPKNIFVKHDESKTYFLVEFCEGRSWESDQFLKLDLRENYGDAQGFDTRIVFDYYRNGKMSDKNTKLRIETYIAGKWFFQAESRQEELFPMYDVNDLDDMSATEEVGEGQQVSPLGDVIPAGAMWEFYIPRITGQASFKYAWKSFHISNPSVKTYTYNDNNVTIDVDGFSCDWLGYECGGNAEVEEDLIQSASDWTSVQGIAFSESTDAQSGVGSSLTYSPTPGELHFTTEVLWKDVKVNSESISLDVLLPDLNWWVGTVRIEFLFNSQPYYMDLGNVNINPSSLNNEWVTYTFPLNYQALVNATQSNHNALTPDTPITIRLGINLNPNGRNGNVYFDNMRFNEGEN